MNNTGEMTQKFLPIKASDVRETMLVESDWNGILFSQSGPSWGNPFFLLKAFITTKDVSKFQSGLAYGHFCLLLPKVGRSWSANCGKQHQPLTPTSWALFFPYSHQPSMDEPPTPTDVRPSPLLKSRVPRKTIIVDHNLWESVHIFKFERHHSPCRFRHDEESRIYDLHCPLRKGIICYRRDGAIFEHNIHSSGKHEVDSHAAHWQSRLQLTIPWSHESLSQNIHRRI